MDKKPFILLTNDDGINALGIRQLWSALRGHADIAIIAPASEQSAVGLSITLRRPLHVEKICWPEEGQAWSVTGTPADSVKMALSVILPRKPDLVVSGINRGTNSGRVVLYSGTVGGAIEAVMQDIPSVAFSCFDYEDPDYESSLNHIPKIVHYVLKHSLPEGTLLNVNFPPRKCPVKGIKMSRQGKGFWAEDPDRRSHPSEGNNYYWLGAKYREYEEHPDGDVHLLSQGYITAVPVHVGELTDHKHLEERKTHFDEFLANFCKF